MLSGARSDGPDQAPYIKNTNIQWDRLDLEDLPTMSFPPEVRERYELRRGDIVVCEGGDPGRSFLLRDDLDGVYFQKAVHRVRVTDSLDSDYLMWWLVHAYRTGKLRALCTGTAILHLPSARLKQLEVRFPPKDEQERLANALARTERVIHAARGAGEDIGRTRRAVIEQLLGGYKP